MKVSFNKIIISIIILGLIASIPLIIERIGWEETSNQVEIVLDYDDIFLLTNSSANPEVKEDEFFNNIKDSVTSIGIYESTLERLRIKGEINGDIWVYSGSELLDPMSNNSTDVQFVSNHTYILFKDNETKALWEPLIQDFLSPEGDVIDFNWNEMTGLEIAAPYHSIKDLPLGLDPVLVDKVTDYGFNVVPRLSNSYQDQERTIKLVKQAIESNPTYIIFNGKEVTGYPNHLKEVALILNDKQIGIGNVEMTKEQSGFKELSYNLAHLNEDNIENDNWYIARVHSLAEYMVNKMIIPSPEQLAGKENATFLDLQEQIELAVTERNIRIIYMHAPMSYDRHMPIEDINLVEFKDNPDNILTKTILASKDMTNRLENEGYNLGQAEPFEYQEKNWMAFARWLTLLGGIAVISLLVSRFYPSLKWITFSFGIIGIILAKLLNLESLYFKFIGLGTAVSIPVIAINYSFEHFKKSLDKKVSLGQILKVYFLTAIISFILAWLVVGMFSHVKFSLYLDQFRGVSVLYIAPLLLTLIMILKEYDEPLIKWLKGSFKNYYLLILGILGIILVYYLSRSGNEATISTLELKFRQLLQSQLDIRPRTKEFLFGYPLFVLALYLAYYYKRSVYLLIAASMGQLSIVSTFTHLHTPFTVSVARTAIGLVLGLVIGLILVIAWKIFEPLLIKFLRRVNS